MLPSRVRRTRDPLFKNSPGLFQFAPRFGINYEQMLTNLVEGTKSTTPFYKSAVRTNFDSSGTDPSLAFPDAVPATTGNPHENQACDCKGTTIPRVL